MSTATAASIDDLRRMAKRRLPRVVFDYVDGGAEGEVNLRKNRTAFEAIELTPRYLVDITRLSTEVTLFGKTYAAPFGISAVGLMNIVWPGADLICARLAAAQRIPHMLGTGASTFLEQAAEAAEGYGWFQLYVTADDTQYDSLVGRVAAAGYDVMAVTIDVPVLAKRDRDIRNQLRFPPTLTPALVTDLLLHPRWSIATLRAGVPNLPNVISLDRHKSETLAKRQERLRGRAFDWDDLRRLRDKWKGRLLLKGILHPEDASLAVKAGCDGLIVSNHGGRQLDSAQASIDTLPAVARAVGDTVPILLDSGIRRGADIIRAKARGAQLALCGRAFAYGAGAGGHNGCIRTFDILEEELTTTLAQLGRPNFADVDKTVLANPPV